MSFERPRLLWACEAFGQKPAEIADVYVDIDIMWFVCCAAGEREAQLKRTIRCKLCFMFNEIEGIGAGPNSLKNLHTGPTALHRSRSRGKHKCRRTHKCTHQYEIQITPDTAQPQQPTSYGVSAAALVLGHSYRSSTVVAPCQEILRHEREELKTKASGTNVNVRHRRRW